MSKKRNIDVRWLVGLLVCIVLVIVVIFAARCAGQETVTDTTVTTAPAATTTLVPSTTTSVVEDASTFESPFMGDQANCNPLLGSMVFSWADLYKSALVDKVRSWYPQCLKDMTEEVGWRQIETLAPLSEQQCLLGILVSSLPELSNQEAYRQIQDDLKARGYTNVPLELPVIRAEGFYNTQMNLLTGRWEKFWDDDSQIRLILLIPIDPTNLSKGYYGDRFVLAWCGNPCRIYKQPPTTTTASVTSTTCRSTTTTCPVVTTTTRSTTTTTKLTTTTTCPVTTTLPTKTTTPTSEGPGD